MADSESCVRRTALEEAMAAWGRAYEGLTQPEIDRRVRGFTALVRGIAANGVVTPEDFSRDTSLSRAQASELFESLAVFGLERDDAGRIVGATRRACIASSRSSMISTGRSWCCAVAIASPSQRSRSA